MDAFVEQSAQVGIHIFRVFDAVNDERNHERAAKAIKECPALRGYGAESIWISYPNAARWSRMSVIDANVLVHQIPGGMTSNFISQLKQMNALDKLLEVQAEAAVTRAEFGYPPLVTPTSQIVGVQAVQNVLAGRYKIFSTEARNYIRGLYGRPPVSVSSSISTA